MGQHEQVGSLEQRVVGWERAAVAERLRALGAEVELFDVGDAERARSGWL